MADKLCSKCGGTGWRPVESGGVRRVVRCDCVEESRSGQLIARSRIPSRYEHCEFENFDVRKDKISGHANLYLQQAKLSARRFVDEYPLDYGLLFIGPTGAGKTHLAVAVIRELMLRRSVACLFYDFRDLLKEIQDSYNPVSHTSELRVLEPVLDAQVFLLDEVAALNPSDWVKDTLAYVINSRYNQKKLTLITTTLPVEDSETSKKEARSPTGEIIPAIEKSLSQYGVTLRSRLYEMCRVVEMQSDDYRKAIKRAAYRTRAD